MKRQTALLIVLACCMTGPDAGAAPGGPLDCDALRQQIAAKIDANGVPSYSLQIVQADDAVAGRIVGSCDGGRRRIAYRRIDLLPSTTAAIAAHEIDVAVTLSPSK